MTTQERIALLIEGGHEARISALADRLEVTSTLPEALATKLNALGETPISEPQVYEAIESGDAINIALNTLSEDEIKQFTAVEIGSFVHAVDLRVKGYRFEDGTFKSTPSTEDCNLPNFIEADKLRKAFVKQRDTMVKWQDAPVGKEKDKLIKDVTKVSTELDTLIMEISGLDKDTLTDWEKGLVITMVAGAANNAFLSAQGKPFAL
jgi:hypothetical protein